MRIMVCMVQIIFIIKIIVTELNAVFIDLLF